MMPVRFETLFSETSAPTSAPHLSGSPLQSVHLQFPLSLLYIYRLRRSFPPSLRSFLIPSISPSPPSLPPTSAQGCQSFRDPVSCEIAQIAVALRLAQQQKGEIDREKKRERFYASTLLNLNRPPAPLPPSLPLPPLIHSDMDKHTHSCKTAYLPTTTQIPPPAHTHSQLLLHPHHHHHL